MDLPVETLSFLLSQLLVAFCLENLKLEILHEGRRNTLWQAAQQRPRVCFGSRRIANKTLGALGWRPMHRWEACKNMTCTCQAQRRSQRMFMEVEEAFQ